MKIFSKVAMVVSLTFVPLLTMAPKSQAISKEVYQEAVDILRKESKGDILDQCTEILAIITLWLEYLKQQADNGNQAIGQAFINGQVVPTFNSEGGAEKSLTFAFINPENSTSTSFDIVNSGFSVASVLYEVNLDPDTPDVFETLGVSNDPMSNFEIAFTPAGFEPLIVATPFDSFGNPIFISGVDNNNVATGVAVDIIGAENIRCVPEPGLALGSLFVGTLSIGSALKRRKR